MNAHAKANIYRLRITHYGSPITHYRYHVRNRKSKPTKHFFFFTKKKTCAKRKNNCFFGKAFFFKERFIGTIIGMLLDFVSLIIIVRMKKRFLSAKKKLIFGDEKK